MWPAVPDGGTKSEEDGFTHTLPRPALAPAVGRCQSVCVWTHAGEAAGTRFPCPQHHRSHNAGKGREEWGRAAQAPRRERAGHGRQEPREPPVGRGRSAARRVAASEGLRPVRPRPPAHHRVAGHTPYLRRPVSFSQQLWQCLVRGFFL